MGKLSFTAMPIWHLGLVSKVVFLVHTWLYRTRFLLYQTHLAYVYILVLTWAELENNRRNGLLNALQRSFSKNIKVLNDGSPIRPMLTWDDRSSCGKPNLASASPEKCSICSPGSVAWHKSCRKSDEEPPADDGKKNSMAIVPVKKLEIASCSVSLLLRELPELKPGWPLLRRAITSNRSPSYNSQVRQISVVQWAMRLPSRYCLFIEHSTRKDSDPNHDQDKPSKLDGETGAIVPVGNETMSVPSCLNRVPRSLPDELEGLHEKYSATCRLFKFRELESATSNFTPGFCLNFSRRIKVMEFKFWYT